jgi:hypothetical protein
MGMPDNHWNKLPEEQWNNLLSMIEEGACIPFIGPEVYVQSIQKTLELTEKPKEHPVALAFEYPMAMAFGDYYKEYPLAMAFDDYYKLAKEKYGYPLEYSYHLARVAQFLAIAYKDELYPKIRLSRELKKINPPNFYLEQNRNTPYAVLADLKLPLYITTNYDYFMEEALKSRGKHPVSDFCRWNEKLYNYTKDTGIPSVFDKTTKYEGPVELKYRPTTRSYTPTESEPLVYHLHGIIDIPESMVLTEKDYFDFVINLNKDQSTTSDKQLLPRYIRRTLPAKSFLFVGYRLEDITFRVIFQALMSFLGNIPRRYKNVAVQIPTSFPANTLEKVQAYLDDYIKDMYFELIAYWGSLEDFFVELRQKLDQFRKEVKP